jgi:transcriptional regulator with XRE-family HTH domain
VPDDVALSHAVAKRLGAQIRELREARNLTQEKLADAIGVTRNHVQLMESGLSDRAKNSPANPRLSTLLALSNALDAQLRIDFVTPSSVQVEFARQDPEGD